MIHIDELDINEPYLYDMQRMVVIDLLVQLDELVVILVIDFAYIYLKVLEHLLL